MPGSSKSTHSLAARTPKRRGRTSTSSFGVSRREGHDSSRFYKRKLYISQPEKVEISCADNPVPNQTLNRIFCKSSEQMTELPDRSVHLAITSPPYNVGKAYDADLSLDEYLAMFGRVCRELQRVLVDGGRFCLNVANIGRKPYIPIHSYMISELRKVGFLMRGEIIWDKGSSAGSSTAWGSWRSASNPSLRDVHEYILVLCKGTFGRPKSEKKSTISRDEFLEYTKSIWRFPAESASRVGHPAPFPLELPKRCIKLYSFENDVVLDPFCGSGSTCIAARDSRRNYVGYETESDYVRLANRRLQRTGHGNEP